MKITVIAIGSRGDIVPHIALSQGLISAGHTVCLITHLAFEELVRSYSIPFCALDDEPKEFFQAEGGNKLLNQGTHPSRFFQMLAQRITSATPLYIQHSQEACRDADTIIAAFPCFLVGHALAEKYQKRLVMSMLQPMMLSTAAFPEPADLQFPQKPFLFRKAFNQRSHSKAQQSFGQMFLPSANLARKSLLNLPPLSPSFYTRLPDAAKLILCGFSSLLVSKPVDWNEKICLTGFWMLKHHEAWQPENELVDFLHAGSTPIYIGFGSMRSYQPVETVEIVEEALTQIGQRGILLVDPNVYSTQKRSDTLYLTTGTAHDWLFPRMQAIVHHGGAGTTAAGLQAGVPAIVVPSIADQWFWGSQVARIGAGPQPIDRMQLTAKKLAEQLARLLQNPGMRQKAKAISAHLGRENGVVQAVKTMNAIEALETLMTR
ncbi:MAG TPA: glycosyltransferase [Ktedonobacteraceae bacterium]|nr:glycosyltransferase [Ktedonobacteraceae bacterium]